MKKHISILMLLCRSSIYPVLLVLAGMAVSETALFYTLGREEASLLDALSEVPFAVIAGIAIILTAVFLSRALCDRGGKLNNTIQRLGISEKGVFAWQVFYNILVFILLFTVQALVMVMLSLYYIHENPDLVNQHTLFVTAYQHPHFHTFFPLENLLGWLCNGLLIAGLGICTAAYPFRQRHGMRSISTVMMVLLALFYLFLQGEESHLDMDTIVYIAIGSIILIFSSLAGVLSTEVDDYA